MTPRRWMAVAGWAAAVSLVGLMSVTAFAETPSQPEPPAEPKKVEAPVVFDGKPLFVVRERVLSFSPEDRAIAISNRLKRLSRDMLIPLDALTVAESELGADIVAGDLVIMTVTNQDARAAGRSRQELAAEYADLMRRAIEERRHDTSLKSIAVGAGFALIATVVLVVIHLLLGKLLVKTLALIDGWRGTRIQALKIQTFEVLSADRIADGLIGLAKLLRVAALLVLLYIYVPLVLSFFPWTQSIAAQIAGYVLSPLRQVVLGFVRFLPNAFSIIVIVVVARFAIKGLRVLFQELARGTLAFPSFRREWAWPTYKIVRFLLIAFTAVVVFPYLPGSDSPAFRGASVFLGILFSLGSTAAIGNVVAGLILNYTGGFKIGDRVKIADTVGDVVETTLLVTRIRTIKNVEITVPNGMVLGSHIINYSTSARDTGLILHTTVTIGYDAPWKNVHELLISAARATRHVLRKPEPFVLQTSLDDFYVSYEINAYTDQPNQMATIYSELHQNIQDKFNEAGVEIMSAHYAQLRDGNQTTIPQGYLPETYQAPAFRVASPQGREEGASPRGKAGASRDG